MVPKRRPTAAAANRHPRGMRGNSRWEMQLGSAGAEVLLLERACVCVDDGAPQKAVVPGAASVDEDAPGAWREPERRARVLATARFGP